MKTIFTFLACVISFCTFAQKSNLIVFNNTGQQFFVILNGIKQNSLPSTSVKVEGLTPTAYKVKIIFADGRTGDIDKNIYLESNMEYSAQVVIKSPKKRSLRLYNMDELNKSPYGSGSAVVNYRPDDNVVYSDQQNTSTTTGTTTIQTNPNGTTSVQTSTNTQTQTTGTHTHADGTVHDHNHNPVKPNTPVTGTGNTHTHADGTVHDQNHQPVKPTTPATGTGNTHTHADGTVHDHNHNPVVSPDKANPGQAIVNADGTLTCKSALTSVDHIITGIKASSFSSDQMELVKTELKTKCINSDQAYRIVNAFTFDGDRVKMAKFCYDHMMDKTNANKLLDLFTYTSSKDELKKYFSTGK